MVDFDPMSPLPEFKLERYFGQWEFRARHLLSASDCETLSMADLISLADDDGRRRWQDLRLGYTESQGHPALREAIAGQYTAAGPEHVLIAVPEEAIFIAMQALLAPGQHVITVHPAYQRCMTWPARSAARSAHGPYDSRAHRAVRVGISTWMSWPPWSAPPHVCSC